MNATRAPAAAAAASDPASAWVDPDTQRVLTAARAAPAPDFAGLPIADARRAFNEINRGWNAPLPPLPDIHDQPVPGAVGDLRARLYRPSGTTRLPVIVYLHGGGWTFGSVDTHDRMMRLLAADSGCAVLGIDYRLAPENPYPAGLDDALGVLGWIAGGGLGAAADPGRVALAGDSAGANLALATLIALRDQHRPLPRTAALFYGCFAPDFETASHRRFGEGFVLTSERMRWFWKNYLGRLGVDTTALAAPSRADLRGLPPLFLNAAGLDPLLDDTTILAGRLAHAGVRAQVDFVPGVVHGFLQQTREVAAARAALARGAAYLAAALAASASHGAP